MHSTDRQPAFYAAQQTLIYVLVHPIRNSNPNSYLEIVFKVMSGRSSRFYQLSNVWLHFFCIGHMTYGCGCNIRMVLVLILGNSIWRNTYRLQLNCIKLLTTLNFSQLLLKDLVCRKSVKQSQSEVAHKNSFAVLSLFWINIEGFCNDESFYVALQTSSQGSLANLWANSFPLTPQWSCTHFNMMLCRSANRSNFL